MSENKFQSQACSRDSAGNTSSLCSNTQADCTAMAWPSLHLTPFLLSNEWSTVVECSSCLNGHNYGRTGQILVCLTYFASRNWSSVSLQTHGIYNECGVLCVQRTVATVTFFSHNGSDSDIYCSCELRTLIQVTRRMCLSTYISFSYIATHYWNKKS